MKAILLFLLIPTTSFAMVRALNTAATGMASQEASVNTISNNIANVNTIGYKKQRAEFEDLMYQTVTEAGARSSETTMYNIGVQIGSGSKVSSVKRDFIAGSPRVTQNPFDLMIKGDGFFGITTGNGDIQYTRDGAFSVNNQGTLVTKHGYSVFPGITFPPNTANASIAVDGTVEAYIRGQQEPINLGQIPVFTFINRAGLKAMGGNLYTVTRSSGAAIQNIAGQENAGPIEQGTLENSNVSIMNEMTNLIRAQRAYEMNSKVMTAADQMLQTVNNIR